MFNIRKHAFSEKWRNIISAVIYIIFIIYSVNLLRRSQEEPQRRTLQGHHV